MDSNFAVKTAPPEPAAKPQPDLRQRVQSLRLPSEDEMGGSPWKWLIWLVVLAGVGVGGYVGYRALVATTQPGGQAAATNSAGSTTGAAGATGSASNSAASPTNSGNVASGSPTAANISTLPANSSTANPSHGNTAALVASSGEIAHESKGYIIPAHKILISPKVPGMITSMRIEEGQRVKKGDVLAQLETTDYEADYQRAAASVGVAQQRLLELQNGSRKEEVAEAQAELEEAQAQRTQLTAEWQRIAQLHKNGISTQSEYDLAEANYKSVSRRVERLQKAYDLMVIGPRPERVAAAEADLAVANAEMAKAKWRLDNCTIKAPSSGTILTKGAEEGNIVNPVVMNGSYSLCEMADLANLEVDLNIQERDIKKIFQGQKCKLYAEAWRDRIYDGYVSRIMPAAVQSAGAVPVRVKISVPAEEEGVYLKPNMGAVVTFLKDPNAPADRTAAGLPPTPLKSDGAAK
ncbi:MAG TPA: efflux RND transporter periplasmic adaptor subunit [Pirellulales bacterium]|jgi:multidrug resistance efflux pump